MKLTIHLASNAWWVMKDDDSLSGDHLTPDGIWTNDRGDFFLLRISDPEKHRKKYFNSKRWAIAVAKKTHPRCKIRIM